jgi:hypothetical protein
VSGLAECPRARYYEPSTGQFPSRDPLSSLTRSPYGYVDGNPLNGTDASGLINTVPLGWTGDTASCVTSGPEGNTVSTVIRQPGQSEADACGVLLKSGRTVSIPADTPPMYGSNGMQGGVSYPAEVNGGHYNDGPVVNAQLGDRIAGGLLRSGAGCAVFAFRGSEAGPWAAAGGCLIGIVTGAEFDPTLQAPEPVGAAVPSDCPGTRRW